MPNGILIIDKPQDWTSMMGGCLLRAAALGGERRDRHGTDPMATAYRPPLWAGHPGG